MKTYCENINNNEIALHCTPGELAFILDLVNSIEHPVATKLRKILEPVVRSHDRFQLLIDRKIEICGKCKGDGKINDGNLRDFHNHDTIECYRCDGAGRKIKITSIRYEKIVRVPAEVEGG